MRQEYIDKLKEAKENLLSIEGLPFEENDKRCLKGYDLVEELCKTKDTEVLKELLEFFNRENNVLGGFFEHMKDCILEFFY